jgi:hypothetical protein
MTTWSSFLVDLRIDLKDTGATPRWSNDTLYLYTKDAIRAYSLDFPVTVRRETLTASGGSFTLPSGFSSVITVESEADVLLEMHVPRPGTQSSPWRATSYTIMGGVLYLDFAPDDGDTILLSYKALHDMPEDVDDDDFVFTIPGEDEELIRLYIKAKVAEQVRQQQSNLDRFRPGSGNRDDNPLLPEVDELFERYDRLIQDRKGGFIVLYRPGRLK